MSETQIKQLKHDYPSGTRIMLEHMREERNPVPDGTAGTVIVVDDVGTIHCTFDNNRQIGILPDVDIFHKL